MRNKYFIYCLFLVLAILLATTVSAVPNYFNIYGNITYSANSSEIGSGVTVTCTVSSTTVGTDTTNSGAYTYDIQFESSSYVGQTVTCSPSRTGYSGSTTATVTDGGTSNSDFTIASVTCTDSVAITSTGCHCNSVIYTTGYCCSSVWQSGSCTTTTTTGGFGGGGGGVAAPITTTTSIPKVWSTIKADEESVYDITKVDMAFTEIKFKLVKDVTSAELSVTQLDKKPASVADVTGTAYGYFSINHKNIADDTLKYADLTFKVKKAWLTENNYADTSIVLYRDNGGKWEPLTTRKYIEATDATYVYYKATTFGFSYFVIATKAEEVKKEVKEEAEKAPEEVKEEVKEVEEVKEKAPVILPKIEHIWWFILPILVIAAVIYYFYKRESTPAKKKNK